MAKTCSERAHPWTVYWHSTNEYISKNRLERLLC